MRGVGHGVSSLALGAALLLALLLLIWTLDAPHP